MKITEKPNTYRTTNRKLLDGRHDRLINVHCTNSSTNYGGRYNEYMYLIVEFYLNPVKPVSNTVATSSQTTPTSK